MSEIKQLAPSSKRTQEQLHIVPNLSPGEDRYRP